MTATASRLPGAIVDETEARDVIEPGVARLPGGVARLPGGVARIPRRAVARRSKVPGIDLQRLDAGSSARMQAALLGRDHETAEIARLLDEVHQHGSALVIRGEAGVGKSALLSAATSLAAERGMTVVATSGVRSEVDLPFAGLHQLLRPWLARLDSLPAPQRGAIEAAFGISEATAPAPFMIAVAALGVLGEAAARTPLLLAVEDAHWLDRPTADVLAFIGRRVDADPIVLLAAVREGYPSPLLDAGLPQLHLRGLAQASAGDLLNQQFPDLTSTLRERILEIAGGNPLALLELPLALTGRVGRGGLAASVPLTARLEDAFASRAAELPAVTRTLLRIAAADERASLAEIISAAAGSGSPPSVEDLVPAIDARLIEFDGTVVRFRHPLISSAIYQASTVAERHTVHAALAQVLDDPDRRVWHRAAAAVGIDAEIASDLEEMGLDAQRRGANTTAAAAFERAAALTPDASQRGRLLLGAAHAAAEFGASDLVAHLLQEARSSDLGPREQALAMWLEDSLWPGAAGDPTRIAELTRSAEAMTSAGEIELALDLTTAAAFRCYIGNVRGGPEQAVLDLLERIEVASDDPRRLQILAYAAPIERGPDVIAQLPPSAPVADAAVLSRIGTAASQVGAFERAAPLLRAAAAQLRDQGRLRALTEVLLHQTWAAVQTANYAVAMPAAEEAERLAAETAQPMLQIGVWTAQAVLAALRGEQGRVQELTEATERAGLPAGSAVVLALAQYARGLAGLGRGLHEEAYHQLRRVYQPGDPAYHHQVGCFVIGDFAEAATRSDHADEGARVVAQHQPFTAMTPSPFFHGSMRYAQALLAVGADAERHFVNALSPARSPMPFLRARLQLAYGEWLRRNRRVADSRAPLREARDAFDALGTAPWGERARQELRASGESSRRRMPHALDELTPQELQIVQMAAEGLSNREIGQRLYLSHRTVESHLYRVFPKLGVTSRSQLASTLASMLSPPA
jgi:RNA polymerase sigma factor (sigma-70 family)